MNEDYEVSERIVQAMMTSIFKAIFYCHERGVVHRDLKPENMLMSGDSLADCTLKIADFGLARLCSEKNLARTIAGSPGYIAPEILLHTPYDSRCDYWSLGVILYLCLSGALPFNHDNHAGLFKLIKRGEYSMNGQVWAEISAEAKDLIAGLLVVDPNKRLTKEQISSHPWISGKFEASEKLLSL